MKIFDDMTKLEERKSLSAFTKNFSDEAAALKNTDAEMTKLITNATGTQADALNSVIAPYHAEMSKMEKLADFTKDGWVKKASASDTDFSKGKEAYEKATETMERFLLGKEKVKVGTEEIEIASELKTAYEKAQSATKKAAGIMNSPFGMARIEGWGEAAMTESSPRMSSPLSDMKRRRRWRAPKGLR